MANEKISAMTPATPVAASLIPFVNFGNTTNFAATPPQLLQKGWTASIVSSFTTATVYSIPHGLGRLPVNFQVFMVAIAGGSGGFLAGDIVKIESTFNGTLQLPITTYADQTNIYVCLPQQLNSGNYTLIDNTGAQITPDPSAFSFFSIFC